MRENQKLRKTSWFKERTKIIQLAWEVIKDLQPDKRIGTWFLKNATFRGDLDKDGIWRMRIFLEKKRKGS